MSGLSDEDRERAHEIAAAMADWTEEQLDELARIASTSNSTQQQRTKNKKEAS